MYPVCVKGIDPVEAIRGLLKRTGVPLDQVEHVEVFMAI
jgi:hypothetical protein